MELADVVDSKSTGSDTVPVRVRPPAPKPQRHKSLGLYFLTINFSLFTKFAFGIFGKYEVIVNSEEVMCGFATNYKSKAKP